MKRVALSLLALLAFSLQLFAVKAYPYPVKLTQPDGSTLTVRIHGDENRSWKTTLDGRPVFQDSRGFWRVTDSLPAMPEIRKKLNPEGGTIAMFMATKASFNIRTIVIPVQFRDLKFTVPSPRAAIYNLFNQQYYTENGATGSVLDYFRDNLGNRCNLSFDVCDVVTLPNDMAWYGENKGGVTDKNLKQLVEHACRAADAAGVDFSRYDFDRDGYVDNVFLIFAGHNESEGGDENTLWPQSWNIADLNLSLDGTRISNFSLYSEYSGPSGYRFAGIGTICHEYCHFLGLQDLYDVNGETEGAGNGLFGSLSVMDQGNYNNEGRTPPYLTIFEREIIGLAEMRAVRQPTELTVEPVQESHVAHVLSTGVTNEDFWIEFRDGSKWDAAIGGTGLVIYHVDKSTNRAGSMTARTRWATNSVNACASHPCVRFLASDGNGGQGVEDAFYPGKRDIHTIHSAYNFPISGWNGQGVGYGLDDIMRGSEGMNVSVVFDDSWNLPVITDYSVTPWQTSALLEWQCDKAGDGQWNIRWGSGNSPVEHIDVIGNNTNYLFENLTPGESYYCELYYSRWNVSGKVYRIEFRALNQLSDYPLIGGLEQAYKAGDRMRLFLLNMTEPGAEVIWSVNGVSMDEDRYTFPEAGSYKIVAKILYPDGSRETLTKILEVKNGQ